MSNAGERSALERHAQTLVLSICTGLVLWVGVTVSGNREQIARLEERVKALTEQVQKLEARLELSA